MLKQLGCEVRQEEEASFVEVSLARQPVLFKMQTARKIYRCFGFPSQNSAFKCCFHLIFPNGILHLSFVLHFGVPSLGSFFGFPFGRSSFPYVFACDLLLPNMSR